MKVLDDQLAEQCFDFYKLQFHSFKANSLYLNGELSEESDVVALRYNTVYTETVISDVWVFENVLRKQKTGLNM